MKEYKIAKGWAIFGYITAPLAIALFCWVLTLPFTSNGNTNAAWFLIPVSLAMIALMVIGLLDIYKGRLILEDDKVTSLSTLSTRVLKLDEIKGYTLSSEYIFVEPLDTGKKRIKINKYVEKRSEIIQWLSTRLPDLDVEKGLEELNEILTDENLAWTTESRNAKLSKARKAAMVINVLGVIISVWAFFYPTPYQYVNIALMIMPLTVLAAAKLSRGLIRINEQKGSGYPSVIYAFIFPSIMLALRVLLDYSIFDYTNVWLITVVISLLLIFLLFFNQKEFTFKTKADYFTAVFMAVTLFSYSYGTVVHINCYYDNSTPQYFSSTIEHKRISSGKTTTYYFTIKPWGSLKENQEVSVTEDLYNKLEIGDDVSIYFRNGKMNIPWFVVTNE